MVGKVASKFHRSAMARGFLLHFVLFSHMAFIADRAEALWAQFGQERFKIEEDVRREISNTSFISEGWDGSSPLCTGTKYQLCVSEHLWSVLRARKAHA